MQTGPYMLSIAVQRDDQICICIIFVILYVLYYCLHERAYLMDKSQNALPSIMQADPYMLSIDVLRDQESYDLLERTSKEVDTACPVIQ